MRKYLKLKDFFFFFHLRIGKKLVMTELSLNHVRREGFLFDYLTYLILKPYK